MLVVVRANVGRDRKTWRNGNPDVGHLGKISTFATEGPLHIARPVGLSPTEEINVFLCHKRVNPRKYNDLFD